MPLIPFLRPKLALVTIALSLLLLGSFGIAAWSFVNGHQESCQARDTTLNVIQEILLAAQSQTDRNPKIGIEQKRASDQFVSQALNTINAARC